jgi:hypothetical protein
MKNLKKNLKFGFGELFESPSSLYPQHSLSGIHSFSLHLLFRFGLKRTARPKWIGSRVLPLDNA